jgi:hypothetical protein
LTFIIFGTIAPNSPINEFLKKVEEFGKKENKIIQFTFVGRCGNTLNFWRDECEKRNIQVTIMGELASDDISKELLSADIGISSTPFYQIEKSGSVAAMREHGLPIICIANPWKVNGYYELNHFNDIYEFKGEVFSTILLHLKHTREYKTLEKVTNKFINSLSNIQ